MSNKQSQRQKREAKKKEARKAKSASTAARLSHAKVLSCISTPQVDGALNILMHVDVGLGEQWLVAFEVDKWCCGLSDVFKTDRVGAADFARYVERTRKEVGDVRRMTVDEVRSLVGGAVRFARQNNFRLPEKYQSFLPVLKLDEAACMSADLSEFGDGGKVHFVGPERRLRQRYLGDVAAFMAREDVTVTLVGTSQDGEEEPEVDADEEKSQREMLDSMDPEELQSVTEALIEAGSAVYAKHTRQWCLAKQITPEADIEEGARVLITATKMVDDAREKITAGTLPAMIEKAARLSLDASADEAAVARLIAAAEQVRQCIASLTPQQHSELQAEATRMLEAE